MLPHAKIRHYLKNWDCRQNVSWSFRKIPIVCQDHLLVVHGWVELYMHQFSYKAVSVFVTWGLSSSDNKTFNLALCFKYCLPHLGRYLTFPERKGRLYLTQNNQQGSQRTKVKKNCVGNQTLFYNTLKQLKKPPRLLNIKDQEGNVLTDEKMKRWKKKN